MVDNGRVIFETYPEGGEVYLNGTFVGLTPLDLVYPIGKYTATIKKEGYHTLSFGVEVKETFPPSEYINGLDKK